MDITPLFVGESKSVYAKVTYNMSTCESGKCTSMIAFLTELGAIRNAFPGLHVSHDSCHDCTLLS